MEVERIELLPQAKFRLIIERRRIPPLVFVGDRPLQNVSRNDVIEMQIEGDAIIESEIFRADRICMDQAVVEGENLSLEIQQEK